MSSTGELCRKSSEKSRKFARVFSKRQGKTDDRANLLVVFGAHLAAVGIDVEGKEVHLTPIEYKLLVLLVDNAGKVLTHSFINKQVWGYSNVEEPQSLRVFMANIRRKIEKNTTHPRYILTEVGVGYRFVDE